MNETLQPGLEYSFEQVVTPDLSPPHLGAVVVLSTPNMVRLMEEASLRCVLAGLDEGENTVGTHVNVSHVAAARGGETVVSSSRLVSIEKRRLNFEVAVTVGDRVIGEGTHQRAVVDPSRFSGDKKSP